MTTRIDMMAAAEIAAMELDAFKAGLDCTINTLTTRSHKSMMAAKADLIAAYDRTDAADELYHIDLSACRYHLAYWAYSQLVKLDMYSWDDDDYRMIQLAFTIGSFESCDSWEGKMLKIAEYCDRRHYGWVKLECDDINNSETLKIAVCNASLSLTEGITFEAGHWMHDYINWDDMYTDILHDNGYHIINGWVCFPADNLENIFK